MTRYGAVFVGDSFECLKNNGKRYSGTIAKVAAYPRGTLVTISFPGEMENDGRMYSLSEMPVEYRSIYLEDCVSWETERMEPSPA